MASWDEGYISDIAYTSGFYRETLPAHIAFAAISVSRDPGSVLNARRVLDLGCGMGFGLALAAASNPNTHFEGMDFNPLHVAHARGLAEAAGLDNVTVLEASFQEMAAAAHDGQQDVDLIVLHGILSWVSDEARAGIVEIARKRLKPGGLLYGSYNSMPGLAATMPLQHLILQNAKRVAGRSDQKAKASLQLIEALRKEGVRYQIPDQFVDHVASRDQSYVAHEYLNSHWAVFHFSEMAELLEPAKLDYVVSATLTENFERLSLPDGVRERVKNESDPIFRETLRDIASNKPFRRDIFGRGSGALTTAERGALFDKMRFVLGVPRSEAKFSFGLPIGTMDVNKELYDRVYDLMIDGPARFSDIAAQYGNTGIKGAIEGLSVLIHGGLVVPIFAGPDDAIDIDPEPARRFNRELCARALNGRSYRYIASPLAGTALRVTWHELLMLHTLLEGGSDDPDAIAKAVLAVMKKADLTWVYKGKDVTDGTELNRLAREAVDKFVAGKLQLWRSHRII